MKLHLSVLLLSAIYVASANAQVQVKFNFGDGSEGNVNNVMWNMQTLESTLDFNSGLETGISLTLVSETGFNEVGPNRSGTDAADAPAGDFFDETMTVNSLFGHSSNFNVGGPRELAEFTIAGLIPAAGYDFTFYASRLDAFDNRETEFQLVGSTTEIAFLDPSENFDEVARVLNLSPDSNGEIALTIQAGPNNDNEQGFFYLGALDIITDFVGSTVIGDFDDSGALDSADVNSLCAEIRGGNNSSSFEITGDTLVNNDDLAALLGLAGRINGDTDFNGEVAFADFLTLSANFGSSDEVTWTDGDLDCNGTIQFADFLTLSANFGASAARIATVPEPDRYMCLLIGMVVYASANRRSRRPEQLAA